MQITIGLQPNHSEYMRLVATLADKKSAKTVYVDFVRHLGKLFARADNFNCSGFGRNFKTRKEFHTWKKKEWDPVADERCTLSIQKRDGRICVSGNYGLILDDWSREETAIALDGAVIALRVYTAGYGLDHVEEWLVGRGASVQTSVEGEEYGFSSFDDALEQVETPVGKRGAGGVRARDGDHPPA